MAGGTPIVLILTDEFKTKNKKVKSKIRFIIKGIYFITTNQRISPTFKPGCLMSRQYNLAVANASGRLRIFFAN